MSQSHTLNVRVNERAAVLPSGTTLAELRRATKPDADVLIRNGFPATGSEVLEEGDQIALIRRGEQPAPEELEALMVARHGPGVHERVRQAQIGVAGCGGLGSAVAVSLARLGVGTLVLVDMDVVEPSNLNRQQYFVDQIGLPKVDALAANLRRINPYVRLESHQTRVTRASAGALFAGCAAVTECFDDAGAKRDLALALKTDLPGTPLVTVSGIAGTGPAGNIRSRRVLRDTFLVGDLESAARPGCGLLSPRVMVAAGHQANIVLRLLLGQIGSEEDG